MFSLKAISHQNGDHKNRLYGAMLKKAICLGLCLALPGALLSACSGDSNASRTLVFRHWDQENQEIYKTLADQYAKEHTGLTIDVQPVALDDYASTELAGLANGDTADVLAVPAGSDLQRFIDSKNLMDLSKTKITPDNYDKALVQLGSRNDHTWAIPVTGNTPVIFFNQKDYTKCQLVVPQTISDFIVNCTILQQNGLKPLALSKDSNGVLDTADLVEGLLVNGPRDTALVAAGTLLKDATALDSGFRDAAGLSNQLKMSDMLLAKDNTPEGHQALLKKFAEGAYSMIPGETSDIPALRNSGKDLSFGFFPMPGANGTLESVFKAGLMLGVSKNTKLKADAEGFISYLLSPSSQETLCNKTFRIPVTGGIKLSDSDLAKAQKLLTAADGEHPSVFQRLSNAENSICLENLDLAFSGMADDTATFMQNWATKIKEVN